MANANPGHGFESKRKSQYHPHLCSTCYFGNNPFGAMSLVFLTLLVLSICLVNSNSLYISLSSPLPQFVLLSLFLLFSLRLFFPLKSVFTHLYSSYRSTCSFSHLSSGCNFVVLVSQAFVLFLPDDNIVHYCSLLWPTCVCTCALKSLKAMANSSKREK